MTPLHETGQVVVRPALQRVRLAGLRLAGRAYAANAAPCRPGVPRSVLLIRPDHLGDLLFLTPALHSLRRALPDARLTLLAGPWGVEAIRGNADIDQLLLCRFPGFERAPKAGPLAPYRLLFTTAADLRSGAYDTAVVLRFDHWWGAWLAAAAGISRRLGYDWPETRPFLTEAVSYEAGRHEVEQNATLLSALAPQAGWQPGPLRYAVAPGDQAWTEDWLRAREIDSARPLVAIHPGAGAAVKQWPPESWAAVAVRLVERHSAHIVLTGGPGERELVRAVRAAMPPGPAERAIDAAGETSLGQLAALYARCDLVLGSDSGPLHLAVASGAPTIHLYGPVSPAKFGPWGDPARQRVIWSPWSCAPCDRLAWPDRQLGLHRCIGAIGVEQVLAAARQMLADYAARRDTKSVVLN